MEIGQKIRQLRQSQGRTITDVAKKIGWTPQNLSNLERGLRTDITVSTLRKIAAALGVKPEELL